MVPCVMRIPALLCALALVSAACAASGGAEKGRLVPLDVSRDKLDKEYAPKKVALIVGIRQFEDAEWNTLRFPEKDAEDLAAVLRDPQRGAFDQVEVLKGGPTRVELRQALARLAQVARDDRDTVVVYVSSHGTLARDARGELRRYLVTHETRIADVPGSAIPIDDLKSEFDALRSRRKVLILATCHSGGGKSPLPRAGQRGLTGRKGGFSARPTGGVLGARGVQPARAGGMPAGGNT